MSENITYKEIKNSEEINAYIEKGNATLGVIGYTEHSRVHAAKVAATAGKILKELNYPNHEIELAKIAGYMHDIGNCINRLDHPHSGALMSFQILREMGMNYKDIAIIINAVGQHDESSGTPVDPVSAALILADKTDVRRNRVRNRIITNFDKHDRVNYAAKSSDLLIQSDKKIIQLNIELDETISSIMDYFEIFLQRMLMCKRACEILGTKFKLTANGNKIV